MEVTVIDDSDFVGWAAAVTRRNEIYMSNTKDMVNNVITHISGNKISRLNILDHGNSHSFQLGQDRIALNTLPTHIPDLQRLRGQFTENGFIHLQHCKIGNDKLLLILLARIINVSIYAGTGNHNPVYRFNSGDYVRVDPNGTFTNDVERP